MEPYYLSELSYDEVNKYRKRDYRPLTWYKVIIKEYSSDYTTTPFYDVLNMSDKSQNPQSNDVSEVMDVQLLSLSALANSEVPIHLKFLKRDKQNLLILKINPVKYFFYISLLEWNEKQQEYKKVKKARVTENNMASLNDPSIIDLLQRIYIGFGGNLGFLIMPPYRKKDLV
ncbi:hypothetical protein [Fredinandcohnia quinoae]|uniref:Uncharacterized protein n=1 Tax=Fredinandcohnia quinoae TaxID=2918902 RepID=A0AAW5DX12_9BACI|nr:hypothetical protein [Fredinandcohnia sp. SECRCQ15]MCH1625185.1 hypothetical protein [Fredinandcohnia sp. SECRCQ15]